MTGTASRNNANLIAACMMAAHTIRYVLFTAAIVLCLIPDLSVAAQTAQTWPQKVLARQPVGYPQHEMVSRLIVKPRGQPGNKLAGALRAQDAGALSKFARVPVTAFRPMSGGAHVIELNQPVTLSEARVIAAQLMRDSNVELAEPDRILHVAAVTPNDPLYVNQWHSMVPSPSNQGGANLPDAWSITEGNPSVTVAVLDTGYRQHADLGEVLPGYDFISDVQMANDGDGRDSDAQDPGDWTLANECATNTPAESSDWHGTHVAGTIAALINNNIGVAGVAPNVHLLPVRVLGKCGGYTSDIVDAMRWAAGIPVTGVPANPYPALVLNMSLGASGSCSATFQSAVADIIKLNKTIVAAAGSDGVASTSEPANCTGVIAVTAHAKDGDNADYANIGPEVAVSAPGGGCGTITSLNHACTHANSPGVYSLFNAGTTVPANDSYTVYYGTSMAAPHVAGVAALMLSLDPLLSPAQIKSYLQSSARPHPSGTFCTRHSGLCGTGLLDAAQALNAVTAPPPTVTLGDVPGVVAPDDTVMLSGSAIAGDGRTIVSYGWTQQSGPYPLNINKSNSASANFIAPQTGTYSLMLTAVDNGGQSGSATAVIRVNSPPVLIAVPAQMVAVGQTLNFSVGATDIDGDIPIYHALTLPSGATLGATGNFTWPGAMPVGSHTLTYYASDDYADSAQGTVNITVTAGTNVTPSGGGNGGGGSLDGEVLAALALLAIGLRIWGRQPTRTRPE